MTISLLLLLSATVSDPVDAPLLAGSTSKSVREFEQCFLTAQQRQSSAVWVVAHEDGARISNEGAPGVANPYRIRLVEKGARNELKLFFDRADGTEGPVLEAVRRCW
jgi:hypothetical protein